MKIKNLKLYKKVNELFHKNEILKVFTKEYKEEIMYREFLLKRKDTFKLESNTDFDLEETIKRLKKVNFESNFEMY